MGWKDNKLYHKLGETYFPSVSEVLQKLSCSDSSKGHQSWCSEGFPEAHVESDHIEVKTTNSKGQTSFFTTGFVQTNF